MNPYDFDSVIFFMTTILITHPDPIISKANNIAKESFPSKKRSMQFHQGKKYQNKVLHKNDLDNNPIISLNEWINKARESGIEDYNAFHLSTSDLKGSVSNRVVLLKAIKNGKIIFFTDYSSRKGQQINANNKVAVTFYWGQLEKQIRIEGTIQKTTNAINDEYFALRPKESQAAAIASNQSKIISNRHELESRFNDILNSTDELKRPENWGGYKINPHYIEFWQGRPNRLNDRIVFSKTKNNWKKFRLAP